MEQINCNFILHKVWRISWTLMEGCGFEVILSMCIHLIVLKVRIVSFF